MESRCLFNNKTGPKCSCLRTSMPRLLNPLSPTIQPAPYDYIIGENKRPRRPNIVKFNCPLIQGICLISRHVDNRGSTISAVSFDRRPMNHRNFFLLLLRGGGQIKKSFRKIIIKSNIYIPIIVVSCFYKYHQTVYNTN